MVVHNFLWLSLQLKGTLNNSHPNHQYRLRTHWVWSSWNPFLSGLSKWSILLEAHALTNSATCSSGHQKSHMTKDCSSHHWETRDLSMKCWEFLFRSRCTRRLRLKLTTVCSIFTEIARVSSKHAHWSEFFHRMLPWLVLIFKVVEIAKDNG